ncbi:HAD family hydrolase [Saccharomonospora azurea]|uniref:Haloacid dehalogenase superfamily enzyme, subfamily IA n=1 Tax=Saccharomonospora azurea NA-128 TaxID=882081 RepID=H8GC29_9PSEU|nr:HAD family hydrolase [Saccharomonospora azurea]EHY87706.1 haloacid dehalogenase superfamily enzyme, subfamily IA [Saccharomonospora azurea NA-128]
MDTALILDVDGTLVDTTYHHALAWYRAFREVGVAVPVWRLHRAIGMGGDQLVAAVAGDEVERSHGDRVRELWKAEADRLMPEIRPFDGAVELLDAAGAEGFRVVLASSGKPDHVDHYLDLIGGRERASAWTSSADVSATKPHPELLEAAWERAGTTHALAVGDSVWDCDAAGKLGIPAVGVRTGGFGVDELTEHGARAVYEDLHELRRDLGRLARLAAEARPNRT